MDLTQVLQVASNLGLGGLLFVMWWYERTDRLKAEKAKDEIKSVLKQNTQAFTSLTEELRIIHQGLIAYSCVDRTCPSRQPLDTVPPPNENGRHGHSTMMHQKSEEKGEG